MRSVEPRARAVHLIFVHDFLRNYSCKSHDVYRMPAEVMRIGMVCAAQYIESSSSDWHRCVIVGFSDGFVQVGLLSF